MAAVGIPVPGILQARTLKWVAISFSNTWKWKVKVKSPSHARLLATPWSAAYQAPPSVGFSSQEYWSGLPLPSLTGGYSSLYKHQFSLLQYSDINSTDSMGLCWVSQFSSVAQSWPTFVTPWTAACQAFLSIAISQSLLRLSLLSR